MAKRDELTLHSDMARIAELMHMGITSKSEIADRINEGRPKEMQVSRQTIANDIERIKKEWKESVLYDYNAAWNQTMAEYDFLKKLAFEELLKSRGIKLSVVNEVGQSVELEEIMAGLEEMTAEDLVEEAKARGGKTIIKKELREANPAFMQLIERIIEKQAKMRAVDGAQKIALTNADGQDAGTLADGIIATLGKVRAAMAKSDADILQEAEDAEELSREPVGLLGDGSDDNVNDEA